MTCYSHSRISTFEQCRYKYKLQYIDKIKVDIPTTIEAYMGSRVHEALEFIYKQVQMGKVPELKEVLGVYEKKWKDKWDENILINKKEYTAEEKKKKGKIFVINFYERHKPFDDGITIGLETMDRLKLDEKNSYHIRIDRLAYLGNGVYEVIDYKTNSRIKTKEEVDEDRQLAMYSLWVKNKFGDAKEVRLVWDFLAFNKRVDSRRTDEQLEALKKEILRKIEIIENAESFPTKPSRLCDWCVYKQICPEWKHLYETEENVKKEEEKTEVAKLVDEHYELKKAEKEIKERVEDIKRKLVEYAEKNNAKIILGKERKARISVGENLKIVDEDEAESKIKLFGGWDKYSKIDKKKLIEDYEERKMNEGLRKEIGKLLEKKKTYRISFSKIEKI